MQDVLLDIIMVCVGIVNQNAKNKILKHCRTLNSSFKKEANML